MWKHVKSLLIVLSVAFNLAFGAMWVRGLLMARARAAAEPASPADVWSPLYRSLGASDAQWRAIEPRLGSWVFPGGYMDVGETAEEAAIRETMEEATLAVTDLRLSGVYTRPEPGVVLIVYEAVAVGEATAGQETSELAWFAPEQIPWADLAFDSTEWALRDWTRRRGL